VLQLKLDKMLADQVAKNTNGKDDAKPEEHTKELLLKDEEQKMTMSYDSGLNSIENESILDEEDEVWMASQLQTQQQEFSARTKGEGNPL